MYQNYCKIRDLHGVTNYQVAKETGISRSTFSDWKAGRSTPKTEKLQKIADYFQVSLKQLTDGVDDDDVDNYIPKNPHERNIVMMYRNAGNLTEEESKEFEEMFSSTLDLYLKARGKK